MEILNIAFVLPVILMGISVYFYTMAINELLYACQHAVKMVSHNCSIPKNTDAVVAHVTISKEFQGKGNWWAASAITLLFVLSCSLRIALTI